MSFLFGLVKTGALFRLHEYLSIICFHLFTCLNGDFVVLLCILAFVCANFIVRRIGVKDAILSQNLCILGPVR